MSIHVITLLVVPLPSSLSFSPPWYHVISHHNRSLLPLTRSSFLLSMPLLPPLNPVIDTPLTADRLPSVGRDVKTRLRREPVAIR